jgi:hypothetical protein
LTLPIASGLEDARSPAIKLHRLDATGANVLMNGGAPPEEATGKLSKRYPRPTPPLVRKPPVGVRPAFIGASGVATTAHAQTGFAPTATATHVAAGASGAYAAGPHQVAVESNMHPIYAKFDPASSSPPAGRTDEVSAQWPPAPPRAAEYAQSPPLAREGSAADGAFCGAGSASHERLVLKQVVRAQIEYYFSDDNLVRDGFLRQQMDADGRVGLLTICAFNRMKSLSADLALVAEAVNESYLLDISDKGVRPASDWQRWAARQSPTAEAPAPRDWAADGAGLYASAAEPALAPEGETGSSWSHAQLPTSPTQLAAYARGIAAARSASLSVHTAQSADAARTADARYPTAAAFEPSAGARAPSSMPVAVPMASLPAPLLHAARSPATQFAERSFALAPATAGGGGHHHGGGGGSGGSGGGSGSGGCGSDSELSTAETAAQQQMVRAPTRARTHSRKTARAHARGRDCARRARTRGEAAPFLHPSSACIDSFPYSLLAPPSHKPPAPAPLRRPRATRLGRAARPRQRRSSSSQKAQACRRPGPRAHSRGRRAEWWWRAGGKRPRRPRRARAARSPPS